jgi:hypothetical protein
LKISASRTKIDAPRLADGRLKFDDEVLEWVREALHASHAYERREHEQAIRRHQAEYKRLDERRRRFSVACRPGGGDHQAENGRAKGKPREGGRSRGRS